MSTLNGSYVVGYWMEEPLTYCSARHTSRGRLVEPSEIDKKVRFPYAIGMYLSFCCTLEDYI